MKNKNEMKSFIHHLSEDIKTFFTYLKKNRKLLIELFKVNFERHKTQIIFGFCIHISLVSIYNGFSKL